jgi:hypothetical protein
MGERALRELLTITMLIRLAILRPKSGRRGPA